MVKSEILKEYNYIVEALLDYLSQTISISGTKIKS
jgi:hypothetical protein